MSSKPGEETNPTTPAKEAYPTEEADPEEEERADFGALWCTSTPTTEIRSANLPRC
ncbi:hypothetical protein COLO4_22746 [Corchorus olitorius]|uniref:Uncharacterized protein n=1 Tax=Corchorus olitorius TaxID=93759 RepID=A0A1R3IK56_9ROSI|nr:hypothetical protein COLO4_22746 [Corchorus olitorius]